MPTKSPEFQKKMDKLLYNIPNTSAFIYDFLIVMKGIEEQRMEKEGGGSDEDIRLSRNSAEIRNV